MRLLAATVLTMMLLSAAAVGDEEAPMPDSIQEVKQRHEATLMSVPGVVSVGIGKDDHGRPVIIVGLESESPETRRRLPERLEGYDVRAQVVGRIRPQ